MSSPLNAFHFGVCYLLQRFKAVFSVSFNKCNISSNSLTLTPICSIFSQNAVSHLFIVACKKKRQKPL